jgi:NAD(P)-dependent dehydrogenase (short-subunit alcohol dehydrogenase family)
MNLNEARHAFVTGGASGIGLGIADALAARGIAVTIADINEEALAGLDGKPNTRTVLLDTRDREGWTRAKAEAEAAFGPVDILVNNAGIAPNGQPFAEMDPESFDRIVAINLTGIVNGVFAFAADMRERGRGHIVNTSSQAGLITTVPGVGAYSVAKFGVTALTEALRAELKPFGVGVTGLFPGYVQTNLGENTWRIGGDVRQYTSAILQSSITARDVGEMVADAIARNASHVVTHKDVLPGLEKRMATLREACEYRIAAGEPA